MAAKISEKYSFPRRPCSSSGLTAKRASLNFSDVQSDIVINVGGVSFSLHKFPLMARSGRIRRMATELLSDSDVTANPVLELINFPGGSEPFELAAKFCYGINFEITPANATHLLCAAEYLEMTEEFGDENLLTRTETFICEVVLESLPKSVQLLRSCEPILSFAEESKIVSRCIDAVACKACSTLEQFSNSSSGRSNQAHHDGLGSGSRTRRAVVEWWADEVATLRVDLYQRVISGMKSRGLRVESLAGALMHYALKTIKLMKFRPTPESNKLVEHEQRILVESIVSMLPAWRKNLIPTGFLMLLLLAAMVLDTTVACQMDLQRRISCQLEYATIDDLLLPSVSEEALFDVDALQRVLEVYVSRQQQQHVDGGHLSDCQLSSYESDGFASPSQRSGMVKVAKLVDGYLAEIAPDPNLKAAKFLTVAEALPEYARVLDDSLYRAVDIFLKAHPTLSDLDRKKLCKLLDCQKLSQEACTHAAQNERLPVQLVVQVLYFEQLRMRSAMSSTGVGNPNCDQHDDPYARVPHDDCTANVGSTSVVPSPKVDVTASLRRDNHDLKLEVARLRLRVSDLEIENTALKQELQAARKAATVSTAGGGFFSFMSRRLGKMGLFASKLPREAGNKQHHDAKAAARRRRHSIS